MGQFILEKKNLFACWKKKIINDFQSLYFSFKVHEFDLESYELQMAWRNLFCSILMIRICLSNLLHTECQTIVSISAVWSVALCPTDCSNPAAGVNNMEAEILANKTLGGKNITQLIWDRYYM